MKFTIEYPLERHGYGADFLRPDALAQFARTAEQVGFSAIAFSEHPAPSRKWIEAGGHHTFEPLAALAFCAAVTSRIRLMPHLLVLPYHKPLQLAKALGTVDILSGGRLTVAIGTGYLRSEFAALGVDFDERNKLFDEAVGAIAAAWTGEPFAAAGIHFQARDQLMLPRPIQQPMPPLWIGGNSALSRRRVVSYGSGWTPMVGTTLGATVRTPSIVDLDQLAEAVDDLGEQLTAAGRDPGEVDIQIEAPGIERFDDHVAELHRYAKAGVTSTFVHPPATDLNRSLGYLNAYGESVIAHAG